MQQIVQLVWELHILDCIQVIIYYLFIYGSNLSRAGMWGTGSSTISGPILGKEGQGLPYCPKLLRLYLTEDEACRHHQ